LTDELEKPVEHIEERDQEITSEPAEIEHDETPSESIAEIHQEAHMDESPLPVDNGMSRRCSV
jgi:demethoxyubiquinone hydroxylase (CLK1/Coq7/Cat5 family)